MVNTQALEQMNAQQLRDVVLGLMGTIKRHENVIADKDQIIVARDRELLYRKTKIDQLTQELALHRRWKFGRSSEQLSGEQASLLDESLDADIAAMEAELAALAPSTSDTDKESDRKQKAQARPVPGQPAAYRVPPRTRFDDLPVRLRTQAHRRGRQREAGLRTRHYLRRAPHPRQVGLRPLPDDHAGASAAPGHR